MKSTRVHDLLAAETAWIASYHEAGHFFAGYLAGLFVPELTVKLEDRTLEGFSWNIDLIPSECPMQNLEVAAGGGAVELLLRRQHPMGSDEADVNDQVFGHTFNDRAWLKTKCQFHGVDHPGGQFCQCMNELANQWISKASLIDCMAEKIYNRWRAFDFLRCTELKVIAVEIQSGCL